MNDDPLQSLRAGGRLRIDKIAEWSDLSEWLAALDSIGREGAVVLIKVDGGRSNGSIYTIVISGGRLAQEEYFRKDGSNLAELIREAIAHYVLLVPTMP